MTDSNNPLDGIPSPHACTNAPNFPELLWKLKCSIAITTYQAGKLIFISPLNENIVIQLPRNFSQAMGISTDGKNKMVLATKDEVILFSNSRTLALNYPAQSFKYDSLFVPRVRYNTGMVDMHDIHIQGDEVYGVNTLFSCVVKMNGNYSFEPIWSPPFISDLMPEDRCHLNGLALVDGEPAYCTALGKTDTPRGWKEKDSSGGVLIDIRQNKIVLENLAMPHSPVWYNEHLYFVESASGTIKEFNPRKGQSKTIFEADKFIRGMSIYKDYMFVGLSKIRPNSSSFKELEITKNSTKAGIIVIHIPTGSQFSWLTYEASVDEIYDIQVIPDKIRPNILNAETEDHKRAIAMPGRSFWAIESDR